MSTTAFPNMTLAQKIGNTAVYHHHALQKADELIELLDVCIITKPKIVVEIGCDAGGTLFAWSKLPSVEQVIGITLQGGPFSTGRPLNPHGAYIIRGNSHDLNTHLKLLDALRSYGEIDMLFIDGDHTYKGAKSDLLYYGEFVRDGGMIVLQDICPHDVNPIVEVDRVWAEYRDRFIGYREIITDPPTWGGIGILWKGRST